jgi:hypothetical protein
MDDRHGGQVLLEIVICTCTQYPLLARAVRPQLTFVQYQLPRKLGKAYNLELTPALSV